MKIIKILGLLILKIHSAVSSKERVLVSYISFLIFITFSSCSLFHTDDDGKASPRDYDWTIDTLAYDGQLQTKLESIWGGTSNDVYAVGHCSTLEGTMWHFNGNEWQPVILSTLLGGKIPGNFTLRGVFGINNQIYAAGRQTIYHNDIDSSIVLYYNGSDWQQIAKLDGYSAYEIYGVSENDLWVGCTYGNLYHFNGENWIAYDIPVPGSEDPTIPTSFTSLVGNQSDNIYALVFQPNLSSSLIHYNGTEWELLDQFSNNSVNDIWISSGGELYGVGDIWVKEWNGAGWDFLYEANFILTSIYGIANDNIIVTGYSPATGKGAVLHYNGEHWNEIQVDNKMPEILPGIWGNDNHVFICGYTSSYPNKTIIYHGR